MVGVGKVLYEISSTIVSVAVELCFDSKTKVAVYVVY